MASMLSRPAPGLSVIIVGLGWVLKTVMVTAAQVLLVQATRLPRSADCFETAITTSGAYQQNAKHLISLSIS